MRKRLPDGGLFLLVFNPFVSQFPRIIIFEDLCKAINQNGQKYHPVFVPAFLL
jgi:hypothetical protein